MAGTLRSTAVEVKVHPRINGGVFDARLELVSAPKGLFGRKTPGVGGLSGDMAERIGSAGVAAVAGLAEEKALWGRFGLSG